MKIIKSFMGLFLLLTVLVACDKEEDQNLSETQVTQLNAPDIDPLQSGAEKAPMDPDKMDGNWLATHIWTPNSGWQELSAYGPGHDFYYGTFMGSVNNWVISGGGGLIQFNSITDTTQLSFEGSTLYYVNNFEAGWSPDLGYNFLYTINTFNNHNALLVRSQYEDAVEPNTHVWFVRQ